MRDIVLAMDAQLKSKRILPVYGLPPPLLLANLEKPLREFRQWLRDWADDFIPFYDVFLDDDKIRPDLLPDGVHPDEDGQRMMGEIAADFLRPYL